MSKYIIGIDNGGSTVKAGLYDLNGNVIKLSSFKTKMIIPNPGWTERDQQELLKANTTVTYNVIKESGVDSEDIIALAIIGHGNGLYLVDENGNAVYPGIYSTDARAQDYISRWYSDGTFDAVHPKIMQSIWAGQPVALLSWFKDNKPEILDRAHWAFMCKDFIRYCFTGEAYAELTDISGTCLLNNNEVKYDTAILKSFGLEKYKHLLPPIKKSADICGYITDSIAKETGLKPGTPVAGGLFDIDACAIATGVTSEENLSVIAGTWSINQYISPKPLIAKEVFMTSLYCIPDYWLITEASATSASNLEWFVDEFLIEEKKIAEKQGRSVYEICNNAVASINPEDSHIVFMPFLYGTNEGVNSKSCFIGLAAWHKRIHVIRAIFEGIVFSHKVHIERLLKHRNSPKAIRIAGGATRSNIWMQLFADILQIPIEVTNVVELGTLGAAICSSVAVGEYSSFEQASANMVKITKKIMPDKTKKDIYDKKYIVYQKAVEVLEPLWDSF